MKLNKMPQEILRKVAKIWNRMSPAKCINFMRDIRSVRLAHNPFPIKNLGDVAHERNFWKFADDIKHFLASCYDTARSKLTVAAFKRAFGITDAPQNHKPRSKKRGRRCPVSALIRTSLSLGMA